MVFFFLFVPHLLFLLASISRNGHWLTVLRLTDINEAEDLAHHKTGELQGGLLKMGLIPNQMLLLSTPVWLFPSIFQSLILQESSPKAPTQCNRTTGRWVSLRFRPGFLWGLSPVNSQSTWAMPLTSGSYSHVSGHTNASELAGPRRAQA